MLHPWLFLMGYKVLRFHAAIAGEVLNLCQRGGYVYRDFSFCGEYACMICSYRTASKLLDACRERNLAIVVEREVGVLSLLKRYRYRFGVFVGILLFCGIVFSSGRVLWSIRVEGNETLDEARVIEALAECGMQIGDPLRRLDTAVIENRMLILSDEISWISINMIGTVAQVEIREFVPSPEEPDYAAANLVASRSGQIENFEDVRGNIAVHIGDVVAEGELLVGGLYDVENGGIRYTRARGKVFARTERDFLVEIPLRYEKKVYTGRSSVEKYWIFFKKEGKFFGNTGNSEGVCDTINTVEFFELPGGVKLPFGIRTVRYLEYELCETERSRERAIELAHYGLRCRIESAVRDGQLVRKSAIGELTEDAYILRCTAGFIENIAVVKKIEIEGIS